MSGYNKNIKEQINNENDVKSDQSQFSHDSVTGRTITKHCDNIIDKSIKGKTVKNNDVDFEKSVLAQTDLHDRQPVQRSSQHSKPVVRLNYEGEGGGMLHPYVIITFNTID